MIKICIIIIFIVFIRSFVKERNFYNPIVSFSFLFLLVLLISDSGLFGLYPAPERACILITCGVLSFTVGGVMANLNNRLRRKHKQNKLYKLNDKKYNVLLVICCIVLAPSVLKTIMFVVAGGSLGDLYYLSAAAVSGDNNEFSKNDYITLLELYIAFPLLYLLVPISIVEFFRSYKYKYLAIALVLVILRVGIDVRRTYIVAFIMMFILCLCIHRMDYIKGYFNFKITAKRFNKKAIALILILLFSFIYLSGQRSFTRDGVDTSNFLMTFSCYYGGCVQFFESVLNVHNWDYTYGFSSLRGLFAPVFGITGKLGLGVPDSFERATSILNTLHYHIINISPTKSYNSFTTAFYQFYCDGGYFGIILLSIFYGYFSQNLFIKMKYVRSSLSESLYVFFYANVLMLSFVNMETVLPNNILPLILAPYLYKKQKYEQN